LFQSILETLIFVGLRFSRVEKKKPKLKKSLFVFLFEKFEYLNRESQFHKSQLKWKMESLKLKIEIEGWSSRIQNFQKIKILRIRIP
jgi:hypothetical protein